MDTQLIFDFITEFYFKGVLLSGIILSICRLLLTRGNISGFGGVIIGAFLRPTLIGPRTSLNYFYNIRLNQDIIKYKEKLLKHPINLDNNNKQSENHNQIGKSFQNGTLNSNIT